MSRCLLLFFFLTAFYVRHSSGAGRETVRHDIKKDGKTTKNDVQESLEKQTVHVNQRQRSELILRSEGIHLERDLTSFDAHSSFNPGDTQGNGASDSKNLDSTSVFEDLIDLQTNSESGLTSVTSLEDYARDYIQTLDGYTNPSISSSGQGRSRIVDYIINSGLVESYPLYKQNLVSDERQQEVRKVPDFIVDPKSTIVGSVQEKIDGNLKTIDNNHALDLSNPKPIEYASSHLQHSIKTPVPSMHQSQILQMLKKRSEINQLRKILNPKPKRPTSYALIELKSGSGAWVDFARLKHLVKVYRLNPRSLARVIIVEILRTSPKKEQFIASVGTASISQKIIEAVTEFVLKKTHSKEFTERNCRHTLQRVIEKFQRDSLSE